MPIQIKIEDIPENNLTERNQNLNQSQRKNKIDYDDILRNMGMREVKGKLFWEKNKEQSNEIFIPYEPIQHKKNNINNSLKQQAHKQTYPNSYIYNKYFKNELKETHSLEKPKNIIEYRNMLIKQIIEKKKVEYIKSRKMIFK